MKESKFNTECVCDPKLLPTDTEDIFYNNLYGSENPCFILEVISTGNFKVYDINAGRNYDE